MSVTSKDDTNLYSACSSKSLVNVVSGEDNSYSPAIEHITLDNSVLLDVIGSVTTISPIVKIARFNEVNSMWRYWTKRMLVKTNDLLLEVPMGNKEGIFVQGSYMENVEQALECVKYLMSWIATLKRLSIKFCGPSVNVLNVILDHLIASDKVNLEVLVVSGRRGGLRVDKLSVLMMKCAETLKIASTIGISELEQALSTGKRFSLEQLSLTNHDLLNESEEMSSMAVDMHDAFVRICSHSQNIQVQDLSVSVVNGFNPAIDPYNQFLRYSNVRSLHVFLYSGDLLGPDDVTGASILPSVHSFQTERFQKCFHLPVSLHALFPSLSHLNVNALEIPMKGLEQAFAYAAEWLALYGDKNLIGVLSTEVHYEYDPLTWEKIRCYIEEIDKCGGKLRLLTSDLFSRRRMQFVILNTDSTFQFKIYCSSDAWILADLLDFELPSLRSVA
uniref:F-box/LRR-repeat protein n=1 Tax=Syphacia muris TaxID=451379 RepID=A0A0N5AEE2_9BILA